MKMAVGEMKPSSGSEIERHTTEIVIGRVPLRLDWNTDGRWGREIPTEGSGRARYDELFKRYIYFFFLSFSEGKKGVE